MNKILNAVHHFDDQAKRGVFGKQWRDTYMKGPAIIGDAIRAIKQKIDLERTKTMSYLEEKRKKIDEYEQKLLENHKWMDEFHFIFEKKILDKIKSGVNYETARVKTLVDLSDLVAEKRKRKSELDIMLLKIVHGY